MTQDLSSLTNMLKANISRLLPIVTLSPCLGIQLPAPLFVCSDEIKLMSGVGKVRQASDHGRETVAVSEGKDCKGHHEKVDGVGNNATNSDMSNSKMKKK